MTITARYSATSRTPTSKYPAAWGRADRPTMLSTSSFTSCVDTPSECKLEMYARAYVGMHLELQHDTRAHMYVCKYISGECACPCPHNSHNAIVTCSTPFCLQCATRAQDSRATCSSGTRWRLLESPWMANSTGKCPTNLPFWQTCGQWM